MYITANGDRCSDWAGVALFCEDSDTAIGNEFDLFFCYTFEVAEVVDY